MYLRREGDDRSMCRQGTVFDLELIPKARARKLKDTMLQKLALQQYMYYCIVHESRGNALCQVCFKKSRFWNEVINKSGRALC